MGTPEDVAVEKYFTPPTLTQMLENMLFHADSILQTTGDREQDDVLFLSLLRETFREWLRTVGLGNISDYTLRTDIVESTRELLITLVDEP